MYKEARFSDDYPAEKVQTIVCKTEQECREALFKMHGHSYRITGKRHVPQKWGPFGLFQRDGFEMSYYLIRGQQEEKKTFVDVNNPAEVARVKDEILRYASGGKSKEEIKLGELSAKLDNLTVQIANLPHSGAQEEKIESIERICEMLEENEFSKEYIASIIARLKNEFSFSDLNDFQKVERNVVDWIGESISIAKVRHHRPPHVIVIVGPTGVGKTTTIAKLAAQNVIRKKNGSPKICIITVDKTRVGAETQLNTFGEVLELKVYKAENSQDLEDVFNLVREEHDIIYIDTSGYSPNDSESIGALKTTLGVDGLNAEIFLAVTASTKLRDLRNIMQNYEPFGYSSMIVTKCDETVRFGNIISVLSEKGKSLSYITDGQKVARDIKKANVVDFLIRLADFSVDRIHIEEKFGGEANGRAD